MTDHPYSSAQGYLLGATTSITGVVTVTNLPSRHAPMLAKSVSTLSELSGGRVALGVGAGVYWDEIVKLGIERRTPGEAVRLFEEAITLVKLVLARAEPGRAGQCRSQAQPAQAAPGPELGRTRRRDPPVLPQAPAPTAIVRSYFGGPYVRCVLDGNPMSTP
jgi:alkanesulfonate monooxygenase SsuD/methylene tetrahydromethanopterin reductase-like flavin-dependent oxidoreductase (luciferase family)